MQTDHFLTTYINHQENQETHTLRVDTQDLTNKEDVLYVNTLQGPGPPKARVLLPTMDSLQGGRHRQAGVTTDYPHHKSPGSPPYEPLGSSTGTTSLLLANKMQLLPNTVCVEDPRMVGTKHGTGAQPK